ncbi:MAG: hypothetical protein M3N43_01475 [Actinomycetota bacterium]|nr:hypothetical protein [Actinomycetota bacterium]
MTKILVRAGLVAAVTAVALTQLQNEQQLLVWELLLLGVVIWEMREIPTAEVVEDRPLFDFAPREAARLPRVVSSAELTVIDALSGHLGPDRRLQPSLRRIAAHRLGNRGIAFESRAAVDALGEAEWVWLSNPTDIAPDAEILEAVVSKVEEL